MHDNIGCGISIFSEPPKSQGVSSCYIARRIFAAFGFKLLEKRIYLWELYSKELWSYSHQSYGPTLKQLFSEADWMFKALWIDLKFVWGFQRSSILQVARKQPFLSMSNTFEVHNILRLTMVCEGSASLPESRCILGDCTTVIVIKTHIYYYPSILVSRRFKIVHGVRDLSCASVNRKRSWSSSHESYIQPISTARFVARIFAVTRSIRRRGYIRIYMSAEMKYMNDMNNGIDEWMEME